MHDGLRWEYDRKDDTLTLFLHGIGFAMFRTRASHPLRWIVLATPEGLIKAPPSVRQTKQLAEKLARQSRRRWRKLSADECQRIATAQDVWWTDETRQLEEKGYRADDVKPRTKRQYTRLKPSLTNVPRRQPEPEAAKINFKDLNHAASRAIKKLGGKRQLRLSNISGG